MHVSCTEGTADFDLNLGCLMMRHLRLFCGLYESATLLRPCFISLRLRSTSLPSFPP